MVKSVAVKYTVRDLQTDFPDDDAVLEWLINYRWPDGVTCNKCNAITKHYKVSGRRSYACGECGNHVHPTAGTIFHKTTTPLTSWLYAIFKLSTTRSGYPARQLMRDIGVTEKTALRMLRQIRIMMGESEGKLFGEVEIDETFIHGNVYKRSSAQKKYGRTGARRGQIVIGMVERGGRARLYHIPTTGVRVVMPLIEDNVAFGTLVYTDGWKTYRTLRRRGYRHRKTDHGAYEWAKGRNNSNNTQSIESLWSRFKMGIKAVYRHVSDEYLQTYANEFAWRHSHRNATSMFWALMDVVSQPAPRP